MYIRESSFGKASSREHQASKTHNSHRHRNGAASVSQETEHNHKRLHLPCTMVKLGDKTKHTTNMKHAPQFSARVYKPSTQIQRTMQDLEVFVGGLLGITRGT